MSFAPWSHGQRGYIAFASLLVIAAVTLAVAVSTALLGLREAVTAFAFARGEETLKVAESCIEEALLRLRRSAKYTGGTLSVGEGSCTVTVSGSPSGVLLTSVGTIPGPPAFTKRILVSAKVVGNAVNILSWAEVE
jgi:hypothetical protein